MKRAPKLVGIKSQYMQAHCVLVFGVYVLHFSAVFVCINSETIFFTT